jgi:hypothetical protein
LSGVTAAQAVDAYRALQTTDVPLKTAWSRPVGPVEVPRTDCTINFRLPPEHEPGGPGRSGWANALQVVADVFAPRSRSRRPRVPSLGGTRLLNVFVGGAPDGEPVLHYVDGLRRSIRPLPARRLADSGVLSAERMTVIVTAVLSAAESLFGGKGRLVVHQDTGFALGVLRTALARHGFGSTWRPAAAGLTEEISPVLGIDARRDIVTAVVDVVVEWAPEADRPPARGPVRRRARGTVDPADLAAVLAAVSPDGRPPASDSAVETFVRCYRTCGIDSGLYRLTERPEEPELSRVQTTVAGLDAELSDRRLEPAALILFTTDLGRVLTRPDPSGITEHVVAHGEAAQQLEAGARARGLDALLLTDLRSTALAPDGRDWRTAYRSFAAVALDGRGRLDGAGDPVVRW